MRSPFTRRTDAVKRWALRFLAVIAGVAGAAAVPTLSCAADGTSAADTDGGTRSSEGGTSTSPPDSGDSGGDAFLGPPVGRPLGPESYTLALGAIGTVYEPSPQSLMGSFPSVFSLDALRGGVLERRVLLGFSQSADSPSAPSNPALLTSLDDGRTFPLSPLRRNDTVNIARLRDGSLLSVRFTSGDGGPREVVVSRSRDDGDTWTSAIAPFDPGGALQWLRWHRDLVELADGTLLAPFYGAFAGDAGSRIALAQSLDGGASWNLRSTIAVGTAAEAYNEPFVVEVADGSLLAVTRTATSSGIGDLKYSRSKDLGVTWTPLAPLSVRFAGGAAGPRVGVDPVLRLLPDGALVLSSGRPDNWVAVSRDGVGASWEQASLTYVNYPTQTRFHGSSGYSGLAAVGSGRLLLAGDNCANSWGCPATDSGFIVDGSYRIWTRSVNVLTSDLGRIDLAGKLASGALTVSGDFGWTSAEHPETRAAAAFDGSTATWSAAVSALPTPNAPATFRVALDHPYDLTRLGLSVGRDPEARARVYAEASDGRRFLVDTGVTRHRALAYYTFDPPVRAAAIVVVVEASAPCAAHLPKACAVVNELELYSTADSFENEALGGAPRGFATAASATVVEGGGSLGSAHALRLHDASSAAQAVAIRTFAAAPAATLSFQVKPVSLPGAFLFDVDGDAPAGGVAAAYRLGVFSDGSLRRYDVGSKVWSTLAPAGSIPIGDWTALRLEATAASAVLFAGEKAIATISPSVAGVARFSRVTFASSGTAPVGDDVLIDELSIARH